jgi:hydrogenase maturation protease
MNTNDLLTFATINKDEKILVFGYGNLGRQDDGLGIEFAEYIESHFPNQNITVESNYQLNIEDALLISEFDSVLFVDATKEENATAPYQIRTLTPSDVYGISSHSMSPSVVLSFCQNLYKKYPKCFLLTLPGYEWDLKIGLTDKAKNNLEISLKDFSERFSSTNA